MGNAVAALEEARQALLIERKEIDEALRGIEAAIRTLDRNGDSLPRKRKAPEAEQALNGLGKFAKMGPTEAMLAFMTAHRGEFFTCPTIAKQLIAEGMETKSTNLANVIRGICNRLAKEGRIISQKGHGTTLFGMA